MSWLQNMLRLLSGAVTVLTLVISVVEAVHEGIKGAGAEKKKQALELLAQHRETVRAALLEIVGEKYEKLVDFILSEKFLSVAVDVLVFLLNARGFFPK